MKNNIVVRKKGGNVLLNKNYLSAAIATLFFISSNSAYAQNITCDGRPVQALDFSGGSLTSGSALQPNAVYSYTGVFPGINAEFRILSFSNGASLAAFDNDGLLPRNLNPELVPNPAGGGLVNFRVSFFNASTGQPVILNTTATQIDVDGDNVTLREFVEFQDRFVQFTLNNPTNLNINASTPSQADRQRFESATSTVAPGIDPTATGNMARAVYTNINSFEFSLGTLGAGATTRLTSLSFDCPTFPNPSSTISSADLVTVKTLASGDTTPEVGDVVSFTIQVSNVGPNGASGISLTDLIPSNLTPNANNGTVSAGSYNSTSGLWTLGALDNGASATLTIEGTVNAGEGGNNVNNTTSAANADQPDPSTAGDDLSEQVTVISEADLIITKTNTPGVNGEVDQASDTVVTGSTTTYTITVTNDGPNSVAGAIISDTIISGLTCPSTNNVTISGSGVPSGSFTVADLTGSGIALGTLADGESAVLSYQCTVN